MSEYNETTVAVLEIVARERLSTDEIAEELQCSRSNVTQVLLKLLRAGRVDRAYRNAGAAVVLRRKTKENPAVTRPHRVYVYGITEDGAKRLESLRGRR